MTITALPAGWEAHDIAVRLHLGCGQTILPKPWTNIDRRYFPGVDRVDNIFILQHFQPASVSEIYACHCLDHAGRWTYKTVLRRWFDLLKPGGVLRISTPDFEATVEQYRKTGNLAELQGQLCASQDYSENVRHWHWDWSIAHRELLDTGFNSVEIYDAAEWLESIGATKDCSVLKWGDSYRSLNIAAWKQREMECV